MRLETHGQSLQHEMYMTILSIHSLSRVCMDSRATSYQNAGVDFPPESLLTESTKCALDGLPTRNK